jgi:hypothetical protein
MRPSSRSCTTRREAGRSCRSASANGVRVIFCGAMPRSCSAPSVCTKAANSVVSAGSTGSHSPSSDALCLRTSAATMARSSSAARDASACCAARRAAGTSCSRAASRKRVSTQARRPSSASAWQLAPGRARRGMSSSGTMRSGSSPATALGVAMERDDAGRADLGLGLSGRQQGPAWSALLLPRALHIWRLACSSRNWRRVLWRPQRPQQEFSFCCSHFPRPRPRWLGEKCCVCS